MCSIHSLYVSHVQRKDAIIDRDTSTDDEDDNTDDDVDDTTGDLDEDEEIVLEGKRPVSWRNMIVCTCTITVMLAALTYHGYFIIHRGLDDGNWYRCWQFLFYFWVSSVGFCERFIICLERA